MRLLLDTHSYLWFIEDNPRLSSRARLAIENGRNDRFVSAATLWEIAIKSSLGKLTLRFSFDEMIANHVARNLMKLLPVEPRHLVHLHALAMHHRDPFDRMLVAQALAEQLTLVSCDAALDAYGVARLW